MLAKTFSVRFCILINFDSVCKVVKFETFQVLKKRRIKTCKARAIGLQNYATLLFSNLKSAFTFFVSIKSILI